MPPFSPTDVVGLSLFSTLAFCAVFVTIMINPIGFRLLVIACFGLVAAAIYESSPDARTLTGHALLDTLGLLVAAMVLAMMAAALLRLRIEYLTLRAWLRRVVAPSRWPEDQSPIGGRDHVKRWFVAVAAATGCAVGVLLVQGDFLIALKLALQPLRLVAVLIVAIAAVILVGPVEEYVLGIRVLPRDERGAPKFDYYESFFEELSQHFAWRKLGRLGLLILLGLQFSLLHSTMESVSDQPAKFATVLLSTWSPLLTTYYWCAAMQLRTKSVARRCGLAVATMSGAELFIVFLILWLLLLAASPYLIARFDILQSLGGRLVEIAALTFLLCLLVSIPAALLSAGNAFFGGLVLDYAHRRTVSEGARTTLLLGGVLVLFSIALHVPLVLLTKSDRMFWVQSLFSAIGWTAGLLLSGFPQIVRRHSTAEKADL